MEIKLSAGDKIQVPENCTATIEDNLIIIEEQKEEFKEEFKDGDILISKHHDTVIIFSNYRRNDKSIFDGYFNSTNNPNSGWFTECFRHATEEEKQRLFDHLKEQGLRWNAETKELEKIRRRANLDEYYLFVSPSGKVFKAMEIGSPFDDENYNLGNYYLLNEREQAEEDAKAIKAIFEKRLKI